MSDAREDPPADARRRRRWLWLALRLTVAALALGWTLSRVSLAEMADAATRVTPLAAVAAIALSFGNLLVGAARWRVLLTAYGARAKPRVLFLARVYLVGLFYNTFLPGNVGGDVVRGHVTRSAFGGGAGAYLIVAIERVFGLAGLCLLAATVLAFHPVGGVEHLTWAAVGALVAACTAALSPMVARRLAPVLPRRLGALAAALPVVERPSLLLVVLALSAVTQTVVALTGHCLVAAIDPHVLLGDSLVLVPIALVAMYFPATVAGLGVREAAFVFLFEQVGMARADATAASLAFLTVQLLVALVGGAAHLLAPLDAQETLGSAARPG